MAGLSDVVVCGGGLTVAPRHAAPSEHAAADLRVGPVGPVSLPSATPMEAQRGDGVVWRRHWATDEHLVFDFVDQALVSLGADGVVTFDREMDPELEEHLLFDHVLPVVLARSGHLVLHGGIVSREARGVALVGSSGAGKSTLAAYMWDHGWTVGNDDGVILVPSLAIRAEPTYATLRLTPAGAELVGIDPAGTSPVVGKLRLEDRLASPFRQEPVDLIAVAVVEPDEGAHEATLDPLVGMEAHAELFGSTFHADWSRHQHLPQVIADLAQVVEACTVGRLHIPRGRPGLASAERLLRALLDETIPC